MRAALPHLLERPGATIVTISSVNAFLPDPGVIDYSAAKAALTNLCKSLSKEFGPQGIRVNTISPGPVQTDLWLGDDGVAATVGGASGTDAGRRSRAAGRGRPPTGRFTRPERGRRPRAVPGQRPGRQHHRQRLRDRRRADHDAVATPAGRTVRSGIVASRGRSRTCRIASATVSGRIQAAASYALPSCWCTFSCIGVAVRPG